MSQLLEAFQFIYYTTFERLTFCRGNKIEKFDRTKARAARHEDAYVEIFKATKKKRDGQKQRRN